MLKMVCFAVAILSSQSVVAQARNEPVGTLWVTANKQSTTWLDTDSSLSVHARETLDQSAITQLSDLAVLTPGLDFQPSGQSGFDVPVMRGMSAIPTALSSSTLLLIDGVPVTTAFGFSDAMLDLERVEVARGPQSSLYGRNADGGVIHLHTRKPGFDSGQELSVRLGSRNLRATSLSWDQPLIDNRVAVRLAGNHQARDGYVDNLESGQPEDDRERSSGAAALRWRTGESGQSGTPGEVNLRYRHLRFRDGGASWGPLGDDGDRSTRATDSWNRSRGEQWSLNINQPLSEHLTLEAITGWRDYQDRVRQDTDYTPQPLFAVARDYGLQTLSQEIRLNGMAEWGDWLFGVYADHNDYDLLFTQQSPQGTQTQDVIGDNESRSAFAQLRLIPATDWSLILGGRLEREQWEAHQRGGAPRQERWSHWNPGVTMMKVLGDRHTTYLRYSEGSRSGGFNLFALASSQPQYEPQTVKSWEWGLKGQGAHFRYELALYRMTLEDMQVQQMNGPGVVLITNAARGRSKGLEFNISRALGERWSLHSSLALNRTEYLAFVLAGEDLRHQRVPFTSPAQGQLALRYEHPGGVFVQARASGSRFQYLDPRHEGQRSGYARLGLTIGYQSDWGEWTLFGENLSDSEYHARGLLNGTTTAYSEPRSWGVSVTGRFR